MGSKKRDITQEDILAWADGIVGVSTKESGEKMNITSQAIRDRQKKVKKWMAEKFDVDDYRKPLYGIYPLWLHSVIHNLRKHDVSMTIALGKGLGILVDKQEIDGTGNFTGLSNDELAERIASRLKAASK